MLASLIVLLPVLAAAVLANAIPKHDWLMKRQSNINTTTIPVFNFGPSSTVPISSSFRTGATKLPAAPRTSSALLATTKAATNSSGAGAATGTIPTFNFFPSSTVPASPGATSRPSSGNGAAKGAGRQDQGPTPTGGQAQGSQGGLADLLGSLLDLLGN
ncbi:hypothetical protein F5Y19DRAFT_310854 [Xylariaceae sp. FL1651]|nr:hypothetical protein F5Y19DRAFT_310854 [Xylariaceae sp. FL1651]